MPFACSGAKTNIIKTIRAVSNVSSQSLYFGGSVERQAWVHAYPL